jgi:hypothetical protein
MDRGHSFSHFFLFGSSLFFSVFLIPFFDFLIIYERKSNESYLMITNFSPHLVETTAHNYLLSALNKCHTNRVTIYYYVFNIGIFVLFVLVFGGVLYYCSKGKLSDEEKYRKMMKDQEYIVSKIRFYQDLHNEERVGSSAITDLPYI